MTVLAFIQCARISAENDYNCTSNEHATDAVVALQVHVSAPRASTAAETEKGPVPIHVPVYIQESQIRSNVTPDLLQNSSNRDATNILEGLPLTQERIAETIEKPRSQQRELIFSELANTPSAEILREDAPFVFVVLALAVGGILAIFVSPEVRSEYAVVKKPDLYWYHYVFFVAISMLGPGAIDSLNPALPNIAASLQTSDSAISKLLILSVFVRGVSQLTLGLLSDRFGQKKMLLVSLVLILGGLLICMNASTIQALYLGHFVKGLGEATDAIIQAVVRMLVEDPAKRMHVLSLIIGLQPVVSVVSAFMGSVIAQHCGWRSVYFFLFQWAAVLLMGYTWIVPETRENSPKKPVWKQYALALCNSQQLLLLVPMVTIFAMTISTLVSISFVLADFGFSTSIRGLLMASLPTFIPLGAAATNFALSDKDRSLFATLRLAMGFVCLLLIATLSIGIANANSRWVIMASFWSITFANGMCVPTVMALYLEPLKDACGLASGIILGIVSIASALLAPFSVEKLEAHGIASMLLVLMLIHLVGQAVFWVGFGINHEK